MLVSDAYFTWPKQFSLWKVSIIVGRIVVVGVLTCSTLLYWVYGFKTTLMKMQKSLIYELMLYKYEVGWDAAEATKSICCTKCKGSVDQSKVTKYFKKFSLGYQNFNDLKRSGRPKTGFCGQAPNNWGKFGKFHPERIKRAKHLMVQCGSSSLWPPQKHLVKSNSASCYQDAGKLFAHPYIYIYIYSKIFDFGLVWFGLVWFGLAHQRL